MAEEPVQMSFLHWGFQSLGLMFGGLLLLSGLFSFLMAALLVLRGRGPMAGAALVLVIHTPLFVGLFAAIQGMMSSYLVIAMAASTPKPSEWAQGISTTLIAALVGLLVMAPGYAVAVFGSMFRALTEQVPKGL